MSELSSRVSIERAKDFYAQFRSIENSEMLLDSFVCALHKEILIQGRMYVTSGHICFHANILGWVTNVVVPFNDIVAVEPKNTAILFPNAILVATLHHRYIFASFIFRDQALKLITDTWKYSISIIEERDSLLALGSDSKAPNLNLKKRHENLGIQYAAIDCGDNQLTILHSFQLRCSPHTFFEKVREIQVEDVQNTLGLIKFKQSYFSKAVCDIELEYVNRDLSLNIPVCVRFNIGGLEEKWIQGRMEFHIPPQIIFRDSFSMAVKDITISWLEKYIPHSSSCEQNYAAISFRSGGFQLVLFMLTFLSLGVFWKLLATDAHELLELSLLNDYIISQKEVFSKDLVTLIDLMKVNLVRT